MTFSYKIKEEISKLECSKLERISELSGILNTTADIKMYCIRVQTENINAANRIFKSVKELYDVTSNITVRKNYNFKKNEIYIIETKKNVLSIIKDLGLLEINEAAELVQKSVDPEANIIFGAVIDESIQDEIVITVIATGFSKTPFQELELDNIVGKALKTANDNLGEQSLNSDMNNNISTMSSMSNNTSSRTSISSNLNDYKIDLDIPPFLRRNRGE